MIDYWLSNSDWYDKTLPTGSLYEGKTLRSGSPRCDILVNNIPKARAKIRQQYNLPQNAKILMYAPTFRGGSQGTDRTIAASQGFPDYKRLKQSFEARFGGEWYIFLRLHPQLVARNLDICIDNSAIVDISRADDMYEILAGCDAFMTDYSSAAFDAAVMRIPIFLYADDYAEYEGERGKLLWDLRKLPFPLALTNDELEKQILDFNEITYQEKLEQLFQDTGMIEDGQAAQRVVDEIEKIK
jgi:CDP-glycerol glycerophosphotransferase